MALRTSLLALALLAGATHAADRPAAVTTEIYEDAAVRVYEVEFAPGAEARTIARPFRIVRALTDGRLERRAPGAPPVIEHWRAGEVRALPADTAGTRNVGTAPLRLYIVALKAPPAGATP